MVGWVVSEVVECMVFMAIDALVAVVVGTACELVFSRGGVAEAVRILLLLPSSSSGLAAWNVSVVGFVQSTLPMEPVPQQAHSPGALL